MNVQSISLVKTTTSIQPVRLKCTVFGLLHFFTIPFQRVEGFFRTGNNREVLLSMHSVALVQTQHSKRGSRPPNGVLPRGYQFEIRIFACGVTQRPFWLPQILCHNARCSSLATLSVQYQIRCRHDTNFAPHKWCTDIGLVPTGSASG
jgi:hypothetical protein